MKNYDYLVEYAHGGAQGTIQALTAEEAKEKAKALYDGLQRDVVDKKGKVTVETTKVTNVKVTEVKEA